MLVCTLFAGHVCGGILYHKAAAINQGHEFSLGTIVTPVKVIRVTNTVAVPVPYAVSIPKQIPVPVEVPKPFPYPVPHPVPVAVAKPFVVPHAISVVIPKPVPVPHPVPVPVDASFNNFPVPIDHLVAPAYNPNQHDDYRGYEAYAVSAGEGTADGEEYPDYSSASSQGGYSEDGGEGANNKEEEYNYNDNYDGPVGGQEERGQDASFESTNSVEKREEKDSQNFRGPSY